jgi:hypothetical protein
LAGQRLVRLAHCLVAGFLEPGMHMITKPFPVEALARKIRMVAEE